MFPLRICLRAAAFAGALACLVAPAGAATVDVLRQRPAELNDGTAFKAVRGLVNRPINGTQRTAALFAGSHHLKLRPSGSTDAYRDFIAFSLEVTQPITTSATVPVAFTDDRSRLDAARRDKIATLIFNAFNPAGSAVHHAAVQLAIWKLAYGDIASPQGDAFRLAARSSQTLSAGFFSLPQHWNGAVPAQSFALVPGLVAMTRGYLGKIDGAGPDDWAPVSGRHLRILTSPESQDLVSYTPAVPLPAAGMLLGTGLGALALRRRRRDPR